MTIKVAVYPGAALAPTRGPTNAAGKIAKIAPNAPVLN